MGNVTNASAWRPGVVAAQTLANSKLLADFGPTVAARRRDPPGWDGVEAMNSRFIVVTAVAAAVAGITAGCSSDADGSKNQQPNAQITVESKTISTKAITCTKIEWWLTIKASSDAGEAQAILLVEGDKPKVKTVNLDGFDGFHGVAGEGNGTVDVTFADNLYAISGDAVGTAQDHPDVPKTVHFRIQARC